MTVTDLLQQDFGLLADLVGAHARARPDAPAVIDGPRTATYGQLDILLDRVAAGLQRAGIRPAETIAACASSSLEYVALFLGALRAGVAVSPLAPSSTPEQLVMMLNDCAARLVFLDDAVGELLAPVMDQIGAQRISLDGSSCG